MDVHRPWQDRTSNQVLHLQLQQMVAGIEEKLARLQRHFQLVETKLDLTSYSQREVLWRK